MDDERTFLSDISSVQQRLDDSPASQPPWPGRRACLQAMGAFLGITASVSTPTHLFAAPADIDPGHATDGGTLADASTFVHVGRELLDRFWRDIVTRRLHWVLGNLEYYVPPELRRVEPDETDRWMRTANTRFWRDRNPKTGLIPYAAPPRLIFSKKSSAGLQPVWLMTQAMELLSWFPDDKEVLANCRALADATIKHFDYTDENGKPQGIWIYVDAATASEKDGFYAIQAYGFIGKALMELAQKTGEKRYREWAAQKLEFAWKSTINPNLPLVATKMTEKGIYPPDLREADTDSLYFIRSLYQVFQITQERRYRDWALATTDLWYRGAWVPEWKQFVRKLTPEGKPGMSQIYGDAKYNFLFVLIEAYRVTRNEKYMKRFSEAWSNFLAQGEEGLVPARMDRGKMVRNRGLDPPQTMFIQILLIAYEATRDQKWLLEVQRFGSAVLRAGEKNWRMQSCQAGVAFLRCGLSLQEAKIR